jgi:magnesium-transporting ATPase (P-type)
VTQVGPLLLTKMFEMLTRIPVLTMIYGIILNSLVSPVGVGQFKIIFFTSYIALMFLQNFLVFFLFYKEVLNMERRWNKMELMKIFNSRHGGVDAKSVKISELQVGDVVFMKGDTISPADIMILDTANQRHSEKIFHVSEKRIRGDNKIRIKSSVRNLNNCDNLKAAKSLSNLGGRVHVPEMAEKIMKKLTGLIEYDPPNYSVEFNGSIKFKNDPRVSRISSENMLFCGSKLYTTW